MSLVCMGGELLEGVRMRAPSGGLRVDDVLKVHRHIDRGIVQGRLAQVVRGALEARQQALGFRLAQLGGLSS
jgi:hypothetical protein